MALEHTIRAAIFAGAAFLAGCQTTGGNKGGLQPTGLRPAYPTEAVCPKIMPGSGYFASTYNPDFSTREIRHTGIDIEAPLGTPIRAVADGIVQGISKYDIINNEVRIKHFALRPDGLMDMDNPYPLGALFYSHSAHLAANIQVETNQKVRMGDVIGYLAAHSQGSHSHFDTGIEHYFDPLRAFAGNVLHDIRDSPVKIPYMDQNGNVHPEGSKIIWPIACRTK